MKQSFKYALKFGSLYQLYLDLFIFFGLSSLPRLYNAGSIMMLMVSVAAIRSLSSILTYLPTYLNIPAASSI